MKYIEEIILGIIYILCLGLTITLCILARLGQGNVTIEYAFGIIFSIISVILTCFVTLFLLSYKAILGIIFIIVMIIGSVAGVVLGMKYSNRQNVSNMQDYQYLKTSGA